MAWLIEAVLDEAETATSKKDYYDNKEEAKKAGRGDNIEPIHRNKSYNDTYDTRDQAKKVEYGDPEGFSGESEKFHKRIKDQHNIDAKKYNDAKKWANKQLKPGVFKKADPEAVAQAADAKARHDRRHAANESVDLLVELM